jgi:hypothetical protein
MSLSDTFDVASTMKQSFTFAGSQVDAYQVKATTQDCHAQLEVRSAYFELTQIIRFIIRTKRRHVHVSRPIF